MRFRSQLPDVFFGEAQVRCSVRCSYQKGERLRSGFATTRLLRLLILLLLLVLGSLIGYFAFVIGQCGFACWLDMSCTPESHVPAHERASMSGLCSACPAQEPGRFGSHHGTISISIMSGIVATR